MSRIIMLIPIDQNVGLTTISLSMIYLFNHNQFKKKIYKSILYYSCVNHLEDDTTFIINKYFSQFVHILDNIDFSKHYLLSSEYFDSLNRLIERCYEKSFIYECILIQGISHHQNRNSERINYDIAQNLSAEVIFIANLKSHTLECIQEKENIIHLFLKKYNYKNILGVIFNKINSPFIDKQYNFFKKLSILKKLPINEKEIFLLQDLFHKNFFPIIACIPWNTNIVKISTVDICNFLGAKIFCLSNQSICAIDNIILLDQINLNFLNKKHVSALLVVSVNDLLILIKKFNLFCKYNIIAVLLTDTLKLNKYIISSCEVLIKNSISIIFTHRNTIEILSQLHNFDFNIKLRHEIYIEQLQKYISSFFADHSILIPHKKNNYYVKYSPIEFSCHLKILSRNSNKRIILPESYENRILQAVSICQKQNIAHCVLLGNAKKIYNIADDQGISLSRNTEIIDPILVKDKYIARFLELRKSKGIDECSAKKIIEDNTILGTLILESDQVDGLVSGSINTTANTIRPALQLIKTKPNNVLVSSLFFMLLPNQVVIYADCAINVNPTAEELAEIAIQSADSSKMFGIEPRIAMLSYSTGYSGSGYQVEKVRTATDIVKNRRPDLIIDGPVQYDTAVSETVSKLKAPYSPILGTATIFIFPDLNSGNISYKAVQRSANVVSIGPMLQGLKKPVNDLSRGASIEDILYTIALTSIQAS